MSRVVAFAYPGARLQARFGRLLTEAAWERLSHIGNLGAFLQAARDSPLRPWVLHLDGGSDAHQIERHLRVQFRQRVRMVSDWLPQEWQAALRALESLPDLPLAHHLRRGGVAYPWLGADPAWASLLASARAAAAKPPVVESLTAWMARWRGLWPRMSAEERDALEALVRMLERSGAVPLGEAAAAPRIELRRAFRRNTRAPAGAFAYVALLWLELLRLRGALLRRRLALPVEGAAA